MDFEFSRSLDRMGVEPPEPISSQREEQTASQKEAEPPIQKEANNPRLPAWSAPSDAADKQAITNARKDLPASQAHKQLGEVLEGRKDALPKDDPQIPKLIKQIEKVAER